VGPTTVAADTREREGTADHEVSTHQSTTPIRQ
jgi:hypothetical protein